MSGDLRVDTGQTPTTVGQAPTVPAQTVTEAVSIADCVAVTDDDVAAQRGQEPVSSKEPGWWPRR